jgi:hypothetical protein
VWKPRFFSFFFIIFTKNEHFSAISRHFLAHFFKFFSFFSPSHFTFCLLFLFLQVEKPCASHQSGRPALLEIPKARKNMADQVKISNGARPGPAYARRHRRAVCNE